MVPNQPPKMTARFLCLWLIAGALEYPLAASLVTDNHAYLEIYPVMTACLHLVSPVLLFFAFPRGRGLFSPARLWARNAFMLTLFLPVFGWLLTGILLFVYQAPENPEAVFDYEGEDTVAQGPVGLSPVRMSREERLFRELDFMPLTDILAGNDLNLKRGAIEKLTRLGTAEAVNVLMKHRSDMQPEVRFYVTSAITSVKKRYDEELDAAQRRMKRQMQDVGARLSLANIYLRFARSGLLDESTSRYYENEAVHHLEAVTTSPEAPLAAFTELVEVMRARGAWAEALAVLDRFEKSGASTPRTLLKLRVEILYGAGRYNEVRQQLREIGASGVVDPAWQAAIHLWSAA